MHATTEQIKAIHTLLGRIGKGGDKEYKLALVHEYSEGKETSTKQLSYGQAHQLITDLQKLVVQSPEEISNDTMRKKIIHMARQMGYERNGKADMAHIEAWVAKYGYLKEKRKKLNEYTHAELPALVTQYEQVYRSFLKSIR